MKNQDKQVRAALEASQWLGDNLEGTITYTFAQSGKWTLTDSELAASKLWGSESTAKYQINAIREAVAYYVHWSTGQADNVHDPA